MNTVTFPLLNLELNINKVAFTILGVPIYWYAILIVASLALAIFLCKRKDGKYKIKYDDIIDLSIILIPVAFICARLYYVIFNLKSYTNFASILNIKDGGLAIYGGIIGGAIVIYFFCKKKNIKMLDLLDYIVPYLALGQSIGRWGNFINVEAYGTTTNLPWKMGIKTLNGLEYVHPTFLYESICTFIIFIILIQISNNRKFSGQIVYAYLILYSFIRFFIEGLRIDSLMFADFRISQIVSVVLFTIFSIIYYKNVKKLNKGPLATNDYNLKDNN